MTGILKRLFSKKAKQSKSTNHSNDGYSGNGSPENGNAENNHADGMQILKRDAHCVSRKNISPNALKVLYRLNDAGYQAYLVGGGVRDILLGLHPKDFDVATDATPEEIYDLFRNCRLIGRRFRLAHILYGREVIEVATFRAGHDGSTDVSKQAPTDKRKTKNDHARTSDHGMLTRDNVYGTMLEDAFRRDFTVNALYYTVRDFSVIDYTNGLQDLAERKLRLIGDPDARYREDPVRILRAIRLSCKLNLTIETKTAAPIKELAALLTHVSSARLWDECNKMLLAGHAQATWQSLYERDVAGYMFEQTVASLKDSGLKNSADNQTALDFNAFIQAALQSTDKRIANKQPVTPAFLFAVFLWKPLQDLTQQMIDKGMPTYEANQKAASIVMDKQRQAVGIPKRFSAIAKEMWSLQFRLNNQRTKSVISLVVHPRFRAAYDFLCLRAGSDPKLKSLAKWWTDYQAASPEIRHEMLSQVDHPAGKKRRSYKKKKRPIKRNNGDQV
jgi:poly(A) polymerase